MPDVAVVVGGKPAGRIIVEPPLVIIEVLSPDDRAEDLQERIEDYLRFGVQAVWVINPGTRRGDVHTAEGSREARDGVLRMAEPRIEVPIAALFASG